MSRVVVVSGDVVGDKMAGPAIRATEIARALSRSHDVTLLAPNRTSLRVPGVAMKQYRDDRMEELLEDAEVVLISGFLLSRFPFLRDLDKPIIVDVYDPFVIEGLEVEEQRPKYDYNVLVQNDLLRTGDFFICASEKQRDFWLGMLMALHRIDPDAYSRDPTLRSLIDVVPFGIQDPPKSAGQGLKGKHPGISESDRMLVWGGGIYDWFDPLTLIRALSEIVKEDESVKLFFMGVKHPNPDVSKMNMGEAALRLSKDLGLYDKHVFFADWVPYLERHNYLLDADIGVSLHFDRLETRYSFRTRVLDYIWARLPILCTGGDSAGQMVEQHELGRTVEPENAEQVKVAIQEMLADRARLEKCAANLNRLAPQFTWHRVVAPIDRFCSHPLKARRRAIASEEVEDVHTNMVFLEKAVRDKERHIRNLETLVSDKEKHILNLEEMLREFREDWIYKVPKKIRSLAGRKSKQRSKKVSSVE